MTPLLSRSIDVTLNDGDPVKAARQLTDGHSHLTGNVVTGRVTSTARVQPSNIRIVSVSFLFFVL